MLSGNSILMGCVMLQVETLEDERLLFNIITPDIPKEVKEKIFEMIEQFIEQRSI
jgi:hypothetical protein